VGTVGTEATDSLPGDELVPEPKWSYTLGIAVDASPEAVWPWIAQVGQGRGGFYTYQTLENMAGCRITNTTEILPDYQHPEVGEDIYLHPTAPPMRLEIVDPPNALVLFGSPADIGGEESWGVSTWQFVVNPGPDGGSRLLTRGRYDYTLDWRSRLTFGRFPIEVISRGRFSSIPPAFRKGMICALSFSRLLRLPSYWRPVHRSQKSLQQLAARALPSIPAAGSA